MTDSRKDGASWADATPEARTHTLPAELEASELFRACDPSTLGFETTAEVQPWEGTIGQDDALAALRFGISTEGEGYGVFVLGRPGSGRTTHVRRVLAEHAAGRPTPPDRCYVFGFEDPRRPDVVTLSAGLGPRLRTDMHDLIEDIRRALPQALEGEDVSRRRAEIVEGGLRQAREALTHYRKEFEDDPWVALVGDDEGFTVMPARGGEAISQQAFEALPEPLCRTVDEHLLEARRRLADLQRDIQKLNREAQGHVLQLHREVTLAVVAPRVAGLREAYDDEPEARAYLDRVEQDVLQHTDRFLVGEETPPAPFFRPDEDFFRRYEVNPIVVHRPDAGAPVVEEGNPTLRNLLGHVGGQLRFGVLVTDFTRIVPGALHRANGGYLILDAQEVLSHPFAWGALKRTLRTSELRPGDPGAELGLGAPESLEPRPLPARIKVALVGEPELYYLLRALDPDFERLFKVKVDFAPRMARTPEAERAYAAFVASASARLKVAPLAAGAVARLVEEGSRIAGDRTKLTTRLSHIEDLLVESGRAAEGTTVVTPAHVDAALAARVARERRPERELLELIERGTLAFEPRGAQVGQIHGIALLGTGPEPIGRPIRVLATAFLGAEGVVNIEREAKLAGPIHTKGFLVLSGYLGRHFARSHPMVLSANLSFDQLYEEVEGDSASAAELYALISAIGGVPLRQGIGVTGAINQEGLLLPVGGVTHKVEGFFAACQRRGLTGEQGVLLPRRNLDNLVLRKEVRDAVEAGRFHVWTVDRVEEGWPILCGMVAGEADREGRFPEQTVYAAAQARLASWAKQIRRFGGGVAAVGRPGRPKRKSGPSAKR
jgi:predicted ATP-dependent protease